MTDQELLLAISDIMDKKIKSELQPVRDDIKMMGDALGQRMDALEQRMDARMDALETRIHTIELHLENVTDKRIQLLAENYLPAAKRYEKSTAAIEAIQVDIDLMKGVIRNHSEQLQQLS